MSGEATPQEPHWLARIGLITSSALVTVNIYTGAPLLAIWVGSRIQASQDRLTMGALVAVVATLAVVVFILATLLARINGRYDELVGTPHKARQTSPWLRSMRGEREEEVRREAGITGIERAVVIAVVGGVLLFEAWFFFFAGSSLPNQ